MATVTATSGSPTGNIYVDALIWGSSWAPSLGQGASLTWRPVTSADTSSGTASGPAWTAFELGQLRLALQAWSNVANITFTEQNSGTTDLDYVKVSDAKMNELTGSSYFGYHDVPADGPFPLTGVFNYQVNKWGSGGLNAGGRAFDTLMHEIGHGLGLAHPHDGGGDEQLFPGVTDSGDLGTNQLNQGVWTIMSYNRGWNAAPNSDRTYGWAVTPMALDIAAIQAIYGANTTHNAGANAYFLPLSNGTGLNTGWSCIWDTGGNDSIIAFTATTSVTIDLRAAPLVGANAGGYVSRAAGIIGGFTIANGVVIENAATGSGNDSIRGNDVANELVAGAGNDSVVAAGGNDTVYAGTGDDTVQAGTGHDSVEGADGNDSILGDTGMDYLIGEGGNDSISGGSDADTILGGDGTDSIAAGTGNDLVLGGTGADTVSGSTGNDTAYGQDGDDDIFGGDGDDLLSGGLDNDVISGDAGKDTIQGDAGDDILVGGADNDRLTGDAGLDLLNGGTGNDSLDGGLDADTVVGDDGDDTVHGGAGADSLNGGIGNDSLNGGTENDIAVGGTGNDRIYGLDGDDILRGDDGNDTVSGGAGADSLQGNAGNDTLAGGDGNDSLSGGAGADSLNGGGGLDRYVFALASDSNSETGFDVITDFSFRGGDRIDVSGIDTVLRGIGDDPFTFLALGPGRDGPAIGDLWVQAAVFSTGVFVYGELDGDAGRELVIYLPSVTALTEAAFIL